MTMEAEFHPWCDHAAEESGHVAAYIGGHVDADGAGGGLGDGDHVGQLSGGEPAGALPDVGEEGDGGQAAADGEQPRLEKLKEELKVDHGRSPPLAARMHSPATPRPPPAPRGNRES